MEIPMSRGPLPTFTETPGLNCSRSATVKTGVLRTMSLPTVVTVWPGEGRKAGGVKDGGPLPGPADVTGAGVGAATRTGGAERARCTTRAGATTGRDTTTRRGAARTRGFGASTVTAGSDVPL